MQTCRSSCCVSLAQAANETSREALDLLQKMLRFNPDERLIVGVNAPKYNDGHENHAPKRQVRDD
eukprot:1334511-Amphidinium_carterae.1